MKISMLKEDKTEMLDQIHRMNGYWSNNEKYGRKVFLICLQVALITHWSVMLHLHAFVCLACDLHVNLGAKKWYIWIKYWDLPYKYI